MPSGLITCARESGKVSGAGTLTEPSFRRIFLTRRLHARQNPNAQEYDHTYDNPVRGHMHQARGVNEAADQDCEAKRVKSERHGIYFAR